MVAVMAMATMATGNRQARPHNPIFLESTKCFERQNHF
jgi:hypothetical protein